MWDFIVKLLDSVWTSLSLDFWRYLAIILVIGILAAWGFRRQIVNILSSPQKRSHDTQIFRDSDAIMSEVALSDMIELLGSSVRFTSSQAEMIGRYIRFFSEQGNQFIDKGLQNKHKNLLDGLNKLYLFTAQNFFVEQIPAPATDRWLGLYPDLRNSGDPKYDARFKNYMNQLHSITDAIMPSYKEYRKLVKSKLFI